MKPGYIRAGDLAEELGTNLKQIRFRLSRTRRRTRSKVTKAKS